MSENIGFTNSGGIIRIKFVAKGVSGDNSSISEIGRVCELLSKLNYESIYLDMSDLEWMDANFVSPLRCHVAAAQKRGCNVKVTGCSGKLSIALTRIGFLEKPDGGYVSSSGRSVIPLSGFSPDQTHRFIDYLDKYMVAERGLPAVSAALRLRIVRGFGELFSNYSLHSKTDMDVFTCGQMYPTKHILAFTISDCGIGIPRGVSLFLGSGISDLDAIDWAMTENNTTRSLDVSGGLGLKVLQEFVDLNGGSISIYSGRGHWVRRQSAVSKVLMRNPFPGTMITVKIVTNDTRSYRLSVEADPNSLL